MTQAPEPVEYPPIIEEFCEYLAYLEKSKRTVKQYKQDLLTFFRYLLAVRGGFPVDEQSLHTMPVETVDEALVKSVTNEEIYDFMSYLAGIRGNQSAARARKLAALRCFFKFLTVKKKWIEHSPTENIESPAVKQKLPRFLNEEESLLLLKTVDADVASPYRVRDYAILTFFLNCGMRLSELTGINLRDIDPKHRYLMVLGKGSKERIIYLNDACRAALESYLALRGQSAAGGRDIKDKNALFLSRLGKRISNQTVQHIVYKYLDAAGLGYKRLSTHKLRHTAATLMYRTGKVDVRVLKDILGHEQLTTTQIYTHVSDAQMKRAMDENPLAEVRKAKRPVETVSEGHSGEQPPDPGQENAPDGKDGEE